MAKDFIGAKELAYRSGYSVSRIYAMYANQSGPFGPLLTKLGKKLGIWSVDYEALIERSRKSPPPATERVTA